MRKALGANIISRLASGFILLAGLFSIQAWAEREKEIAPAVSYATSGLTIIFGFTLDEINTISSIIALVTGTFCAIGTFLITWHFKHKNFKLNVREKKRRK